MFWHGLAEQGFGSFWSHNLPVKRAGQMQVKSSRPEYWQRPLFWQGLSVQGLMASAILFISKEIASDIFNVVDHIFQGLIYS